MDRRKFVKILGAGAAATTIPWKFSLRGGLQSNSALAFYQTQSPTLQLWRNPLRGVGGSGIPLAKPDTSVAPITGVTHYTIDINQFTDQLHPQMGPTTLWGYNPARNGFPNPTPRHLGGIIVAQRGVPIQITFRNNLPPTNIIPVDVTVPGANQAQNRTAIHMHGGLVPWISDGGPFDWWAPDGSHGLSFLNNEVLNKDAIGTNMAEYYYPMNQSARMLWYHDHAWGITRTNAYAGEASAVILRDSFEAGLINGTAPGTNSASGLPAFIENGGAFELPLVFQDKIFVGNNILSMDPTWNGVKTNGSLWYAHVYEKTRWKLAGNAKLVPQDPSAIPEFFGDTMLVNGTVHPTVMLEPRRYRLRLLNACNARFLNLQFLEGDGTPDGVTILKGLATNNPAKIDPGPDPTVGTNPNLFSCLMLGNEGGFLPKPVYVPMNLPINPVLFNGSLLLGNAERADILVDFRRYADTGGTIMVYNDAPAPFPIGDPRNDYYPGAPKNPTITAPGYGPNTRVLLKIVVSPTITGAADPPLTITPLTDLSQGNDSLFFPPVPPGGVPVVPVLTPNDRQLTLNENFDAYGRLQQLLGTNIPPVKGTFGRAYLDAPTETPLAGRTEIWQIANLTGDTHPIHFHLVNVQIIARQAFSVTSYNGGPPNLKGKPRPPDPNEAGWKETVRMNPGEVIWVKMNFSLAGTEIQNVPSIPSSPRTGGAEYVWHCHILEHEEHDMMRPLVVL